MSEPDFISYANAYQKHKGAFGTIEKEYFIAKKNKALTSSTVKNLTNKTKALVKNIGNTQTRFVTEYDKYGRSLPLKRATGWKFWEKKNIVNFPKNWAELNRKLVNVKPKTTNDPKSFFLIRLRTFLNSNSEPPPTLLIITHSRVLISEMPPPLRFITTKTPL